MEKYSKKKVSLMEKMTHSSLFFGFALAFMLCCCGQSQQEDSPQAIYETSIVKPESRTLESFYPTTIQGRQDVDVFAQITGKIVKVCVTEGQTVKKGQTLFVIDPVPFQAAYNTAKANVNEARARLATARMNYQANQKLYDSKIIGRVEYRTTQNALAQAQAVLEQRLAELQSAGNNLTYTKVVSPSDGVVGTLPYHAGSLVFASMQQPLTRVSDNQEVWAFFTMNETQFLSLMEQYGSKEKALAAMPDVTLQLSNGKKYSVPGRITNISGLIDQTTGSVTLKAVFRNSKGMLYSGFTGNVCIPSVNKRSIVVPQSATYEMQDKRFIYKVVGGKAIATPIIVLPISNGKEFIVTSGLKPGDMIVSGGIVNIKDGMEIKTQLQGKKRKEARL
ncbi:efflux RND transporter periplasmic adaptor subunit [Segatella copri]|uniref:efflux RND transporter periplasmic adaptor subunit n=1 Tax=Segatella copri TaxID=165179 RepID=UPI0026009EBD|nr:efflux RND transporter periplasmic adaptor subunit [Segatella copri]MDV3107353.1 efflux RND transporter periplasmic adaptor subunit [Segatella copri]WOF86903.1 efflux RND transporter periplasmic adaptor subunit [Segatella copri]WOF93155.1 efflux RND transporter periplasmic adaptor subunit [Segatella copri]